MQTVEAPKKTSPKTPFLHNIFCSPQGLRAGWSLLIFCLIYGGLVTGAHFLLASIPAFRVWLATLPVNITTPTTLIAYQGLQLLLVLMAAGVLKVVERRNSSWYNTAINKTTATQAFLGFLLGMAMAALLIGLIASFGGYLISGLRGTESTAIGFSLLYAFGYFIAATYEEFLFRGYLQSTLTRGIGFWPAAIVLSLGFGAMHLTNRGSETLIATCLAAIFGLVASYLLLRTGSIWAGVCLHAAFDWSMAYVYSTQFSGYALLNPFLTATLHGPQWLTGGSPGPRGSFLFMPVLLLTGIAIHFLFPKRDRN